MGKKTVEDARSLIGQVRKIVLDDITRAKLVVYLTVDIAFAMGMSSLMLQYDCEDETPLTNEAVEIYQKVIDLMSG